MYVYFDVDERSLLRYRKEFHKTKGDDDGAQLSIKELKIPIYVALEGEQGYPHQGVIDFADNKVNPSTGTIQVRGVLPNPNQILDAGMRARVRVPVSDPHKVLMVTERAIGTDQGRKFVYVVNEQDVVERRDVTLDRLVDGMQIIKEGLEPTDWVIVNGIQRVRDGIKVQPREAPMPGGKQLVDPAQPTSKELREQRHHVCSLLRGPAGLRHRPLRGDHHRGPGRPREAADCPVPGDRPAHHLRHGRLSRAPAPRS